MKKFLSCFILTLICVSCASTGSFNPTPTQRASIDTFVIVTRGVARVTIAAELKKHGASDVVVQTTLDSLHKGVDDLLAGKKIGEIVSDPALWATFKDAGVKQLATLIVTAYPVVDEATAELLIGQALDVAQEFVKQKLDEQSKSNAPNSPTAIEHLDKVSPTDSRTSRALRSV